MTAKQYRRNSLTSDLPRGRKPGECGGQASETRFVTEPEQARPLRSVLFALVTSLSLVSVACSDDHGHPMQQPDESTELEDASGTYEVIGNSGHVGIVEVVGNHIEIRLDTHSESIVLEGELIDERVELTGSVRLQDTVQNAIGQATVSGVDGQIVIDLVTRDGRGQKTFKLIRDPNLDLSIYSGHWDVTFFQSPSGCELQTTARYALNFSKSGIGAAIVTHDEAGAVYGEIKVRSAVVAPSGRVLLVGSYAPAPIAKECSLHRAGNYGLTLWGQLTLGPSGRSGVGSAEMSLHPVFMVETQWSAQAVLED